MTRITPMTVLLVATAACGDDFEMPTLRPGERHVLVQDEMLLNTCAEDSPPFRDQRTHFLDIHPVNDEHRMVTYDRGGGSSLWSPRIVPAEPPFTYKDFSQADGWPPTPDWPNEDWAYYGASSDHELDWENYIYPKHRGAFVLLIDGDHVIMEYVWDLNECDRTIDCEPWGGRPCTRHIRKTFAFDRTLPDYAWRIGTLPDD